MCIDNLEDLNCRETKWNVRVTIKSICKEHIMHQGQTLSLVLIDEKVQLILNYSVTYILSMYM